MHAYLGYVSNDTEEVFVGVWSESQKFEAELAVVKEGFKLISKPDWVGEACCHVQRYPMNTSKIVGESEEVFSIYICRSSPAPRPIVSCKLFKG